MPDCFAIDDCVPIDDFVARNDACAGAWLPLRDYKGEAVMTREQKLWLRWLTSKGKVAMSAKTETSLRAVQSGSYYLNCREAICGEGFWRHLRLIFTAKDAKGFKLPGSYLTNHLHFEHFTFVLKIFAG